MSAGLSWMLRRVGLRNIFSFVLLASALCTVALGLANVVRGFDAELALTIVALGSSFGWILARSHIQERHAALLALIVGIALDLLRVGQIGTRLLMVAQALGDLARRSYGAPLKNISDLQPVLRALAELWMSFGALFTRTANWTSDFISGLPAFDPVAAALVWSLLVWLCAVWAAWMLRRREQPLLALLPALALLGATYYYGGNSGLIFVPLLGALLLLLPLTAHRAREGDWQKRGIDFSEDIRTDLALVAVPLAFALVLAAALTPSFSVRDIVSFVQHWNAQPSTAGNRFESLGLQPAPRATTVFDELRTPGLPRQHLIGAGPELSEQLALIVHSDDFRAGPPAGISGAADVPRYYWRSATFDYYSGRGWSSGVVEIDDYKAGAAIDVASPVQRRVHQEIQVENASAGHLYAAGALASVDRDFKIAWRGAGDIFSADVASRNYRVESFVPLATENDLLAAGNNYPERVRATYLQLPPDLPPRVLSLARDLTATAATPYERARALENYLRTFPYTLDLPAPPPTRDVVDYFLFDLKKGYCDYYASAMVVLARAAGLPARLVIGYASGGYDVPNARELVTEAEAHSWVEIYFPKYGWIEFEPTAGRAPLDHSVEINPNLVAAQNANRDSDGGSMNELANFLWLLLVALALLPVLAALGFAADSWRLEHMPPVRAIARIHNRLRHFARRLDLPVTDGATPYELAAVLGAHLSELEQSDYLRHWYATARADVSALSELYVRASYSAHPLEKSEAVRAARIFRGLHWRLWFAWLWQQQQNIFRTPRGQQLHPKTAPAQTLEFL